MIQKNNLGQNGEQIKPDKNHSQIVLEISSELNSLIKAKQIIEGLGVHIVEMKNLSSQRILLELDVRDMRELVLKLTENGFLKIEGYNASDMWLPEP